MENKVGLLILEELLPFPEELITQVVKDLNKDTKVINLYLKKILYLF